jgi:hypothetical protein
MENFPLLLAGMAMSTIGEESLFFVLDRRLGGE